MLHLVLFSVFGLICVAGAVNLLVQKHPINSALSLVVVMASLAVEYLLLGAEFVAAVQVIVYAGAIMVLFVFVIMLLNAGEEEHTTGSTVAWLLGCDFCRLGGLAVFRWHPGRDWGSTRASERSSAITLPRVSASI
jgi:NADH:ubiquinone oxidoreductase subunit 6 (subunit J)